MIFCYSAMNGLSINSFGRVRPCCVVTSMRTLTGTPGVTETYDLDWVNTYPHIMKETGWFGWKPKIQEAKHVQDLINDVLLCEMRNDLKNDIRPDICNRCFPVEDQGGTSFRQNYNIDHKDVADYDAVGEHGVIKDLKSITYLDLTLGNTCNLQCKTCNPWSSHNWLKEVQELPHQNFEKRRVNEDQPEGDRQQDDFDVVERGTKMPWYKRAFAENFFDPLLPTVRTINFLGGEPLVVKEHDMWLDRIVKKGWAGNKTLQYTSNGTTIPNRLIDVWSQFERVNLGISIDAIGDMAYYVRHPSNWRKVEENFDKLRIRCARDAKQIYCQLHTTISSLNIINIQDVYDFSYKQYRLWHYWDDEKKRQHGYINILPHINIVDYHKFYHVRHMPEELKEQACQAVDDTYNKYKDRIQNDWEQNNLENLNNLKQSIMQERDPEMWKQFVEVQIASDKFRGLNGQDYIPWFKDYVYS